jgi:hypothetical protein
VPSSKGQAQMHKGKKVDERDLFMVVTVAKRRARNYLYGNTSA